MASAASGGAPRQLRVGLTGGIGCGKSTLLKYFKSLGCACCDDDALVHSLYAPGGAAVEPLRQRFPTAVDESGGISRAELSRLIQESEDPAKVLRAIESIVHPLVGQAKQAFMQSEAAGAWLVILDVPLLMEGLRMQGVRSGPGDLDAIVLVTCPPEVQRRRCLLRPGMTPEKFDLIFRKQMAHEDRLAYADFVIDTGLEGLDEASSLVAGRAQAAEAVAKLASRHAGPWHLQGKQLLAPARSPAAGHPPLLCVTFDLDETLFKINPSITRAIRAATAVLEKKAPYLMAHLAAEGRSLRETMLAAMRGLRQNVPLLAHDYTQVRRMAIHRLLTEAGDMDPAAVAAEATEAFLRERGAVDNDLFPDTLPTLHALRRRGLRLGSVTNGNADLSAFAPRLRAALDFEVGASGAGAAKPGPAPFLAAAEAAGVSDLRSIAHVGDSLKNDVAGAAALGMRAVLLRRPGQPPEEAVDAAVSEPPHTIISSLAELDHLAAKWGAGPPASGL